jgi:hypothetical protein
MRKEGQTDMAQLIVAFSNLAKAPKNKELEENESYCRVFSFSAVQNRNKQNKVLLRGTPVFFRQPGWPGIKNAQEV